MKSSRYIRNLIAKRSDEFIKVFSDIGFTIPREDFDNRFKEIADYEIEL